MYCTVKSACDTLEMEHSVIVRVPSGMPGKVGHWWPALAPQKLYAQRTCIFSTVIWAVGIVISTSLKSESLTSLSLAASVSHVVWFGVTLMESQCSRIQLPKHWLVCISDNNYSVLSNRSNFQQTSYVPILASCLGLLSSSIFLLDPWTKLISLSLLS